MRIGGSRMARIVLVTMLVAATMVAYVAGCSMTIERDRHLRYLRPTANPQKLLANLLDGDDERKMSPKLINTVTINLTDKSIRAATAQERASEIGLGALIAQPTDQYAYTFSATRTTSAGGEQMLAVQVRQGTTVLAQVQVPSYSDNDGLDPEYLAWVSPSLHSVFVLTRLPTYKLRVSVIDTTNPQVIARTKDLDNGFEVSLHGMQHERLEVYDTEGLVFLPWVCCLCVNGQYARYTADSLQLVKSPGGDFIDPRHKAVMLLSSRALNLLNYTAESAGVEIHFSLDQLNAIPTGRDGEGDGTFVDVSCSRNSDCMIVNGEKGPVCCPECGEVDWMSSNYISVNKGSWQELVNDICASTTCLACVPDIVDNGIGPLCHEETCRKGIVKPDKSCSTDADCRIVNEELGYHDCCGSCGYQDWRPDNFVAVNAQWYSDQGGCMGIFCAFCAPGPGNAEARCDPDSHQCHKFVTDDDSSAESLRSASASFL